ncbi:hypothetical protein [Halanaerobium sp. ST460_2HS_T2]|uniref:hypothetical protein n=1 Tax=Halanaerobium sp. ST460_2HS_T2 TaxID=2183914 RepID=UPI000DF41572|nr:hypothetical protein [Halanaerobium sp. ST460_2HS_T2]RCW52337.1 hypothetical protein DFR80_13029 [Halanaerobium sp. ST460_2HS_T2]
MKKMLVLAFVLVFVLSGAVFAQDGILNDDGDFEWDPGVVGGLIWQEGELYANYDVDTGDGVVFVNHIDADNPGDYTNLEEFDRSGEYLDVNTEESDKQEVAITLPAEAYIPCYLEMRLTGNQGTTSAISYGPNASATGTTLPQGQSGYHMVFDNEIGGYLDANWISLGHGKNAEIDPGDEVFIGACDIFAVEVISNDNYKYEVTSEALVGEGGAAGHKLPMYMRTELNGNVLPNDFIFNAERTFTRTRNAGVKLEALHNFKVPFSMNTVHGHYSGEVVFRAVTI